MKRQKDNNAIIFTSEDSGNTDNSYNSSFNAEKNENLEREMYMNRVNKMKDQINQMFTANPALKASLNFKDEIDDEEPVQGGNNRPMTAAVTGALKSPLGGQEYKADKPQQQLSNLTSNAWQKISNSIIGSSMKQKKQPTLKQLNHRINIFKSKVKKYDFETDILGASSPTNNTKGGDRDGKDGGKGKKGGSYANQEENRVKGIFQQDDEDNDEEKEEEFDGKKDIEYFSYRKRVQLKAREKKAEQEERQRQMLSSSPNKGAAGDATNKNLGGQVDGLKGARATSAVNYRQLNKANTSHTLTSSITGLQPGKKGEDKKGAFFDRLARERLPKQETPDATERNKKKAQPMQFLTKHAERLYEALHSGGNREDLKAMAQAVINQFKKERKEALRKTKNYPPQPIKFPTAETKKLQLYLPDFTQELYSQSKEQKDAIFSEITKIEGNKINFQLEDMNENIPNEIDSLLKINAILEGNLFKYWKKLQEQDF